MTSGGEALKAIVAFGTVVLVVASLPKVACAWDDDKISRRAQSLLEASSPHERNLYWLYLDDNAFDSAGVYLTEKAQRRRAKVDPINFLIDSRDYPVSDSVVALIEGSVTRTRRISKWLRAVSVEADASQIHHVASLPIVRRIDLLNTLTTAFPEEVTLAKPYRIQPKDAAYEYGNSFFQNRFVNAVKLQQAGLSGKGVTIAIFDTGFRLDHPAFDSASIVAAYDFIDDDTTVDEVGCEAEVPRNYQTFHGTLTFGVIGGYVPGALIGIAPGADFVLAKTEITCGGTEIRLEEDNWIAAAEWADSIGVDIINSSLGYTEFTDGGSYTFSDLDGNTALITIAADIAASKNILVVNAAGNERGTRWDRIIAPADGDSVLAVGAVNGDSCLAGFSSPGPTADGRIKPDIVALGVGVYSARHLGGFASANGTSFSTPLVAGGAALAMEHDASLTAKELCVLIHQTGSLSGSPDNDFGYGLYDAAASADIIRIAFPGVVRVKVNEPTSFQVETSGRADWVPTLSAIGLPPWVGFVDNRNGSATLHVQATGLSAPLTRIGLVADVGYFADTVYSNLEVYSSSDQLVYAGPNPFFDSLRIFVDSSAGMVVSVSVFNSMGEIVWEKVNNFADVADLMTETWDGRNQQGTIVAAGVYVVLVKTDRQRFYLKLLKVT